MHDGRIREDGKGSLGSVTKPPGDRRAEVLPREPKSLFGRQVVHKHRQMLQDPVVAAMTQGDDRVLEVLINQAAFGLSGSVTAPVNAVRASPAPVTRAPCSWSRTEASRADEPPPTTTTSLPENFE